MISKVNYLISDENIVVNYNGESHIVKRSTAVGTRLVEAIKNNKFDEIPELVSAAKRIESYSKGAFHVKDGKVMVNGVAAPEFLSNKIVKFANEGLPIHPLIKFTEKLQENTSFRAVNELYQFLEKNEHPITETGNFIAYKRVRDDFKDIYSGTFDNSVGQVLEVPRNQVDEDCNRTCSYGLHVANWNYAHTQYGSDNRETDIMLEVEVNPADVVAVPADYSNSKMRVCKYKVVNVVTTPFDPEISLRVADDQNDGDKTNNDSDIEYCYSCDRRVYDGENYCEYCQCDGKCDNCGESCNVDSCLCEDCQVDEEYPYQDELDE